MRGLRSRLAAISEERGFTLPELLVGMVVCLIVAGGAMTVVQMAVKAQPRISDRANQVQQGRTMIERLSRELRMGETVTGASSTGLTILTYVDQETCGGLAATSANFCRVIYACSADECTRTIRNPDGTGSAPARVAVSGITGPNIFTFSPSATSPSYVGMKLEYPAGNGDDAITLDDGVSLRNYLDTT